MMRAEPGTSCRLRANWWTEGDPAEVEFLRTAAGSCYQVDDWVPSRPGSKSLGTFHCTRLDHDAVQFDEPGVAEWRFWSAKT